MGVIETQSNKFDAMDVPDHFSNSACSRVKFLMMVLEFFLMGSEWEIDFLRDGLDVGATTESLARPHAFSKHRNGRRQNVDV